MVSILYGGMIYEVASLFSLHATLLILINSIFHHSAISRRRRSRGYGNRFLTRILNAVAGRTDFVGRVRMLRVVLLLFLLPTYVYLCCYNLLVYYERKTKKLLTACVWRQGLGIFSTIYFIILQVVKAIRINFPGGGEIRKKLT
jgi:hypothetical protein